MAAQARGDNVLYHLVPKASWDETRAAGKPYFPPTYEQDGFIHLTKEPELLLGVANHFYKDVVGEYVVLCIDHGKLTSAVKFEPAAPVGDKGTDGVPEKDTVLFPHLFGTIDYGAVSLEVPVARAGDGSFLSITWPAA